MWELSQRSTFRKADLSGVETPTYEKIAPERGLFGKLLLALSGLADPILRTAYGSIQAMFRAGTNPTGMRAISFIDLMSTTETLFDCSFAT